MLEMFIIIIIIIIMFTIFTSIIFDGGAQQYNSA